MRESGTRAPFLMVRYGPSSVRKYPRRRHGARQRTATPNGMRHPQDGKDGREHPAMVQLLK
jgi:hypothetical protein